MIGQELVDSLQKEIIRLKALLESSQNENYEHIRERARLFNDPLIGPILKLRREVEGRKAAEADLLAALAETKEELQIVKRTDGSLMDELEEQVAALSGK